MTGDTKRREKIKSGLLVVLFIVTVLLLYVFWSDIKLDEIDLMDFDNKTGTELPSVKEIVVPGDVDIFLGNDLYTVQEKDGILWTDCLGEMERFCRSKNTSVEPITVEKYKEVLSFPHVVFRYFYTLPAADYFVELGSISGTAITGIGNFQTIVWSEGSKESLFFYNKENGICYRVYNDDKPLSLASDMMQLEQGSYDSYYSLGTFAENDTKTLIPLLFSSSMREITWESEFDSDQKSEMKKYAESFFGENFDFIRRITERSGNRIFMYGYGQKVLTLNANGSSEYKEEQTGNQAQGCFDALQQAIQFIGAHGGWPSYTENGVDLYVKTIREVSGEKGNGYQIVFGVKTIQGEIFCEGTEAVIVYVMGGQVTYYYRDICRIASNMETQQEEREAYQVVNLLTENSGILAETMEANGQKIDRENESQLFTSVCDKINRVAPGYLLEGVETGSEQEMKLRPVWAIVSDEVTFYFDLYTAEYLGTNKSVN